MQGLRSQGDSAQRAAYLKAVVWQYPKGPVEHGDTFYFAAWLIHHLTQLPDEDAIPVLKAIWQCTDCHTWYRDRVQRLLLRWKVIRPDEQIMLGLF